MNAKNASIAALVCGIVGLVACFLMAISGFIYVAFVLSILGIVFGVKGRKLSEENQKGMATAGMVLGIIGVVISGIVIGAAICAIGCFGALGGIAAAGALS